MGATNGRNTGPIAGKVSEEEKERELMDVTDARPSVAASEPIAGSRTANFNHNLYAQKKTITSSLLDLALLSANVSQLKLCLQNGPQKQEFYHVLVPLIAFSIVFQVVTAILFIVIVRRHEQAKMRENRELHRRLAHASYGARGYHGNGAGAGGYHGDVGENAGRGGYHGDEGVITPENGFHGDGRDEVDAVPPDGGEIRDFEPLDVADDCSDAADRKLESTSRINDAATVLVFLITVVNVFICGFGMSVHPDAAAEK